MQQFISLINRQVSTLEKKLDLIKKYINTVRFLKLSQIFYRIFKYFYIKKISKRNLPSRTKNTITFKEFYWREESVDKNKFTFLNQTRSIKYKRDWNKEGISKLWLYNLHYFDYLNSKKNIKFRGRNKQLIYRWIDENSFAEGVGWEPYPTSLRIVNWIRWMILLKISDKKIESSLALQLRWLNKNIENHLLGNHIIANAKALFFGGCFFNYKEAINWREKGISILGNQLIEQIHLDGGHFERSPMYHCIILEDLLDALNLINSNKYICENKLEKKLKDTSISMLRWLSNVIHPDGEIPFFNDSTFGIAPNYKLLKNYFSIINKNTKLKFKDKNKLNDSGFASLKNKSIYTICDIGSIKPDYMPGHSHAETLSFEASFKGKRLIVNSGISNYWLPKERIYERSTKSHSTVEINNTNSSEVWSRFRIAKRANIINKSYSPISDKKYFFAEHDGYKNLVGKPSHLRLWLLNSDNLEILDQIKGRKSITICIRFFLHPKCSIKNITNNSLIITRRHNDEVPLKVIMQWEHPFNLSIEDTSWNKGFYDKTKNKSIKLITYSSLPFINKTIFKIKE